MTLAERWNGVRWSIQPIPSPAASTLPDLNAVSCVSRKLCFAVGSFVESTYTARAFVEIWDGARWSMHRLANPSGVLSSILFGISCRSRTSCIAVGNAYTQIQPVRQLTLAERWNGVRWSLQKTPNPLGQRNPSLENSVSCSSINACAAVGTGGLVERWNGGQLEDSAGPGPADRRGIALRQRVMSVGQGVHSRRELRRPRRCERAAGGALERRGLAGILRIPNAPRASTTALSDVWCRSASFCTAVGHFGTRAGAQLTLAQRWSGKAWTINRTPNPVFSTGSSTLKGVSCTSEKACTAVGSYDNASARQVPLAERWNGTDWALQQARMPGGATASTLNAVSCAGVADVHRRRQLHDNLRCQRGAGGRLEREHLEHPKLPELKPRRAQRCVVPVPPAACATVGGWTAAFWNGSAWTISNALPPNPGPYGGLDGVSCTSATDCTVVGSNPPLDLGGGVGRNQVECPEHPEHGRWLRRRELAGRRLVRLLDGLCGGRRLERVPRSRTARRALGWRELGLAESYSRAAHSSRVSSIECPAQPPRSA